MLQQEELPPKAITNPDIANYLGFSMYESPYMSLALEAAEENEHEAATYLRNKAYQDGVAKTVAWAVIEYPETSQIMDLSGTTTLIDEATNEKLMKDAHRYNTSPVVAETVSPLTYRRMLSFVASKDGKAVPRNQLYNYLGMLEATSHNAAMRLVEAKLLEKIGNRGFSLTPTPKLEQLLLTDNELTIWRDIYRLSEQLGFTSEEQVLHYLAALGHATFAASQNRTTDKQA